MSEKYKWTLIGFKKNFKYDGVFPRGFTELRLDTESIRKLNQTINANWVGVWEFDRYYEFILSKIKFDSVPWNGQKGEYSAVDEKAIMTLIPFISAYAKLFRLCQH